MTKKPKYVVKNRFADSKLAEDEIVLTDLAVNLDDSDIAPVPIDHFLEDDDINDDTLVDSLLVDHQTQHFDEKKYALGDEKVIEDINLSDDLENSAQFKIEPVDDLVSNDKQLMYDPQEIQAENPKLEHDNKVLNKKTVVEETKTISADHIESIDIKTPEPKPEIPPKSKPDDNAAALHLIKETLLADKAFITSVSEKTQPIKPYIPPVIKASKGSWLNNVILGVIGLILLGLSIKVFLLSGDVSKLQLLTAILEEDVTQLQEKKIVNNPNPGLPEPALPNNQIAVPNLPHQAQNTQTAHDLKQVAQVSPIVLDKKTTMLPEKKRSEFTEKLNKPAEQNKTPEQNNKSSIKQLTKKSKSKLVTTIKDHETKVTPKKETVLAPWSVNVLAFKNETEAKNRTSKLIAQGIPVKIDPFHTSKGTWYQLKINGFKNRDKAQSYANKLRKSIKLNSISVVAN